MQIRVTVNRIVSNNLYDYICYLNGLVVTERISDDYTPTNTLCESHDGIKQPSMNFYSQNSSLTLILYWYKGYETINVSVIISQTNAMW